MSFHIQPPTPVDHSYGAGAWLGGQGQDTCAAASLLMGTLKTFTDLGTKIDKERNERWVNQ